MVERRDTIPGSSRPRVVVETLGTVVSWEMVVVEGAAALRIMLGDRFCGVGLIMDRDAGFIFYRFGVLNCSARGGMVVVIWRLLTMGACRIMHVGRGYTGYCGFLMREEVVSGRVRLMWKGFAWKCYFLMVRVGLVSYEG